jgi:hypothetical protein
MLESMKFIRRLKQWTNSGGDLNDILGDLSDRKINKPQEARAVCKALTALRQNPALARGNAISLPLNTLAGFFQSAASKKAVDLFTQEGLPLLHQWLTVRQEGVKVHKDDVMFILKILAMYRQQKDLAIVVAAARKPLQPDSYMWSVIFGQFNQEHPFATEMVDNLRTPLPERFILMAYLDMANQLAIAERLFDHPFNNAEGIEHLKRWLCSTDPEEYSYAHSATAALPFIDERRRALLLDLAALHPNPSVRGEAAWAQARTGDENGVQRLAEMCLQPAFSRTAQTYLNELGRGDVIPAKCDEPEFQALAEMAGWLAHPLEFNRPPDKVAVYDARMLFWPPVQSRLSVCLVRYEYLAADGQDAASGVGMVGSTTFALFSCDTADLPPEDIYALHCCFEQKMFGDANVPTQHYVETGRKMLRERNQGF